MNYIQARTKDTINTWLGPIFKIKKFIKTVQEKFPKYRPMCLDGFGHFLKVFLSKNIVLSLLSHLTLFGDFSKIQI